MLSIEKEFYEQVCQGVVDPGFLLVYSDCLQELGGPRGEIIALEIALESEEVEKLTALNTSNNNIKELPAWLGQLSQLTTLDLRNNNLNELLVWLGQLSQLTTLDLRNNNLNELPEWLGQLSK